MLTFCSKCFANSDKRATFVAEKVILLIVLIKLINQGCVLSALIKKRLSYEKIPISGSRISIKRDSSNGANVDQRYRRR